MRPASCFAGEEKGKGSHKVSLLYLAYFCTKWDAFCGKKKYNFGHVTGVIVVFYKEVTRCTQQIQLWAVNSLENSKELQKSV